MIIPMKKITVLCLDSDKVRTLEELRNLSILHTSISTNVETADVASLAKRLAEVNRAGLALLERKGVSHAPALDAEKAVDRVNEILDAQSATEKSLDNELHMIDLLSQKYCDGIILISFDFCDKNIAAIRASGRPVVLGNRYLGQKPEDCFDYVYVDHIYGMELATDHLIGVGCKNIALVTGDLKTQTTYERLQGYKNSLRRAGITCDEKNILNGRYDTEGSYLAFKQFIESGRTCDGVIASNDLAAYGILRYCREAGINVPHDLKLVSCDNTDYAELCMPSLSSIDMCQYELGKSLAETLLSRIEGRDEVLNVNLKPTLVIRQSSGK